MYEVSVEARFVARHGVVFADGSKEADHAHEWQVNAVFRGDELDSAGYLIDFLVAKAELDRAVAPLDGSDLNSCSAMGGLNPTAEHVARVIYDSLVVVGELATLLAKVEVTEAVGCRASFYRDSSG